MSNDETAVPRLVAIDRRQLFLRTVDVERLVEQEHCVRSIWELVGRLDLRMYYAQIAAVEGSAGREHTGDGTTTYTYDAEGRAISVFNSAGGWVCYTYNAEGQRVRKDYLLTGTCPAPGSKNTYDYLLDLNGQPVSIIKNGTLLRDEFYAGNRHLGMYANGTTYFVHADHLGTERVRSSVTGLSYQTCTSLPFGDWMTCVGGSGDPSPIHFTGKQHDSVSGLEDFGARYDSSSMGRFMSPDWSASPEAVPYANLTNPQSLNLYSYVKNNPLSTTDPDGHCCEDEVKFFGQELIGVGKGLVNVLPSVYNTAATFLNVQFVDNNLSTLPLAPTLPLNSIGQVVGSDVATLGVAATGLAEGGAGAAADVQANRAAGMEFEGQSLRAEGLTKNTTPMEAVDPKTGQAGTTIPDAIRSNGQTVEIKNVKNLSDSPQLRRQSEISARSGLKAQVIVSKSNRSISAAVTKRMDVKKPE